MVSKSKTKRTQAPSLVSSNPLKRQISQVPLDDIDDEELSLAIETLDAISEDPSIMRQKRIKPLKAAIHNFLRAASMTTSGTLTARISEALNDARWLDARVLLAEFRLRGEEIKLGTLQRWVREVDAAAATESAESVSVDVFLTLESILRATSSGLRSKHRLHSQRVSGRSTGDPADGLSKGEDAGVMTFSDPVSFSKDSGAEIRGQVIDGSIFAEHDIEECRRNAKIIEVTPAAERKPPNQYDATIYTTLKPLVTGTAPIDIKRHDVQDLKGAFVIENLLSLDECQAIIRQGEAVSFSPDCAVAGSATQQASILAHNFYYFADDYTLNQIYSRALPHLPKDIEGCAIRGINARFRVYRYVPGAVYRPHIDGAWPRSGLDLTRPEGSQYLYDDTREGAQLSRLTFLLYLNDDFTEGYTTFFIPKQSGVGLDAIRVEPRMGSVLVFPHGESIGALLHEGSGVKSGAKYVIRTDVLYEKSANKM